MTLYTITHPTMGLLAICGSEEAVYNYIARSRQIHDRVVKACRYVTKVIHPELIVRQVPLTV